MKLKIKNKYLTDHFVLKNILFIENFDGNILFRLNVPSEFHLSKISFSEGPSEFVPPHTRLASASSSTTTTTSRRRHSLTRTS